VSQRSGVKTSAITLRRFIPAAIIIPDFLASLVVALWPHLTALSVNVRCWLPPAYFIRSVHQRQREDSLQGFGKHS
jgi:hypothetical protein